MHVNGVTQYHCIRLLLIYLSSENTRRYHSIYPIWYAIVGLIEKTAPMFTLSFYSHQRAVARIYALIYMCSLVHIVWHCHFSAIKSLLHNTVRFFNVPIEKHLNVFRNSSGIGNDDRLLNDRENSFVQSIDIFTLQCGKRFNANDKRDTHSAMSVNKNGLLFPLMELHVSQSYQIHCWWRYNDNDNEFLTIGIPIFYAFWLNTGLGKLKKRNPGTDVKSSISHSCENFPGTSSVKRWSVSK